MMKLSVLSLLPSLTLMVTPAFSCGKKTLETVRPTVEIHIPVDWSLAGEVPEGMTLLVYSEDGQLVSSRVSADVSGASFRLGEGTYKAAVFSYSVSEWKSLTLSGMALWETARVLPTDREPDTFACAAGIPFEIKKADILSGRSLSTVPLRPKALTHPLQVCIRVKGIPGLREVRGAIYPPSRLGLFVPEITPDPEKRILLPDDIWSRDSTVTCTRRMLGPPDSLRFIRLQMAGKDDRQTIDTIIHIQGRIRRTPDGQHRLTLGDRDGEVFSFKNSSDGFHADVDEWTPGEETEIILHTFINKNYKQ